ncbi:putative ATP-grasp superfamily ATP-dependent carboligase [Streptomyces sp. 2333.5]|uniref:ATP-grasp domain-containing protein n=1 Tax=unclassified Streptomyces TaxID=2593676 RepID=UPI00089B44F9|nr:MULTISPECIES: ATP-grasp domain-containing protein [unclassified Streptomyces]PJJ02134.1 putative ATP-grasp superfamily ATP-dependent carboligase [Streptomyces sp. 2333.5]SEC96968.1 Predicted ATP-dependent carboligase, ATP-grasp superfamily [Streptomyces sp. 2314.4]SED82911.1 Predicted ATP-dependent carboligase, ATP-grasp superfamily [Streptomyces sp. 2112.2]
MAEGLRAVPSFDTEVPVLLLRLDPGPFPRSALGVVRSLGRAGIEVHALAASADGPVGRSRYLHRMYARPPGPMALAPLLDLLRDLSEGIGRPAVLLPMDDRGAIAAARLAGRLLGRYLLPAQPAGLPERLADRAQLALLCRELGLPHPVTVVPAGARQAADAAAGLGLPLVAKWSRPWLLPPSAGLPGTILVHTPDDARRLYEQTERAGSALLLQRLLPGGRGTNWFFHGCFTGDGGCLIGGPGRAGRGRPWAGPAAAGRRLPNPQVERAALRLAGHLGYRGLLDLDFRRDAHGRYHLLGVSGRPGDRFRLFTDPSSGLDAVRALHLDLTGRTVPRGPGAPGRRFRPGTYRRRAAPPNGAPPPPLPARSSAAPHGMPRGVPPAPAPGA